MPIILERRHMDVEGSAVVFCARAEIFAERHQLLGVPDFLLCSKELGSVICFK